MLVLGIILLAPLIFKRLKIPNIVGLILAGVLVGPHTFNLLARDASFQIFGQVGILYLMFQAAVDIDMYNLRKNIRKGIVFGLLTFLLPLVGGLLVSGPLLGMGILTSLLVATMYSSHTLVSYPIISKFGLQNSKGALIAVSGTILAVLFALILLAGVVDVKLHGSFSWSALGRMLLMSTVYVTATGWLYPIATRLFFRKVNGIVEQYIFILALVLLASLLAQLIGLEAILGAFYAGLVLNRFIPSRSTLSKRITFVGNAIFIPYFLIGVGMLMDIRAIFTSLHVAWLTAVMVAVALVTKWGAAWLARKIYRLPKEEEQIIFGLTSGKAAATLAATMVGYQYGLVNDDLMNAAVVMILICCIVASTVTERGAIKLRIIRTAEEMERVGVETPEFARQLIAVANPTTAEGLMTLAVYMRSPSNREPASVLFVRNNDDPRTITTGRAALTSASNAAQAMEIPVKEIERYDLNVVTGISNVIKETKSSDVVMGFHRKSNIVDSFYGQMAESLLRSTNQMVILSRCFIPADTFRRVVVIACRNAEYETGFHAWVARIGNLCGQLGCKAIFMAPQNTLNYIEDVISEDGYPIRRIYQEMTTWDDFILLSGEFGSEDLLVFIGARKGSISSSSDFENLPSFLNRYFSAHNLMVIYPGQFGD